VDSPHASRRTKQVGSSLVRIDIASRLFEARWGREGSMQTGARAILTAAPNALACDDLSAAAKSAARSE
jgi:hypothetical protein